MPSRPGGAGRGPPGSRGPRFIKQGEPGTSTSGPRNRARASRAAARMGSDRPASMTRLASSRTVSGRCSPGPRPALPGCEDRTRRRSGHEDRAGRRTSLAQRDDRREPDRGVTIGKARRSPSSTSLHPPAVPVLGLPGNGPARGSGPHQAPVHSGYFRYWPARSATIRDRTAGSLVPFKASTRPGRPALTRPRRPGSGRFPGDADPEHGGHRISAG